MRKKNPKDFINGKGFYVVLSLCFAVIIISAGIITVNNTNEINKQKELAKLNEEYNYEQEAEPVVINEAQTVDITEREEVSQIGVGSVENSVEYQETITEASIQETEEFAIIQTENINETVAVETESLEIGENSGEIISIVENEKPIVKEVFLSFNKDTKMLWPIEGQIVMDYSIDHTIYDKTLDQYRINDSISIAAEVGTPVRAAATGTVMSITHDNQKGYTVVLDHGNGWQTTYSQLQEDVAVKQNEIVEAGDIIGGVENPTKYGIALGGHLDFEVKKDGVTTDPKALLKK